MITPYRRRPPVYAVAMIDADGFLHHEDGTTRSPGYYAAKGLRTFVDRDIAEGWLHRGWGTATVWNDIVVRWHVAGHDVICLGGGPGDADRFLDGLATLRDYLAEHGAAIGSMGSSSRSLARATIERNLWLDVGDPPPVREVIGGRQSMFTEPGYSPAFESWDLTAAYAAVLGALVYPGRWRQRTGLPGPATPFPVIARAEVTVPPGPLPGPLPVRARKANPWGRWSMLMEPTREWPTGRRVQGLWSADELHAAASVGAKVRPLDVWTCEGPVYRPFARWWELVRAARRLPGDAGTLAKVMGNALWGRFAMGPGERRTVWYVDGRERSQRDRSRSYSEPAFALAEVVAASVRARLYTEVIAPFAPDVLAVHTDGALVRPDPERTRPKGWRLKDRGRHLILLGPQSYAYMTDGGRRYKVAGVRPADQPGVFAARVAAANGYRGRHVPDPWIGVA